MALPSPIQGPHKGLVTRTFRNDYGGLWAVRIDPQELVGTLSGSELGDDVLPIDDGQLPGDLILDKEEFDKLTVIWQEETGQQLKPLPFLVALELMRCS